MAMSSDVNSRTAPGKEIPSPKGCLLDTSCAIVSARKPELTSAPMVMKLYQKPQMNQEPPSEVAKGIGFEQLLILHFFCFFSAPWQTENIRPVVIGRL